MGVLKNGDGKTSFTNRKTIRNNIKINVHESIYVDSLKIGKYFREVFFSRNLLIWLTVNSQKEINDRAVISSGVDNIKISINRETNWFFGT